MQEQPTPSLEIVIRGQYVIEGLLGESSAGATYLVRDQQSGDGGVPGTLFVLKEVIEPMKQARRRLASEGKQLRRLQHPRLPRVHQVLKDDKNDRVYLLMEYIAGQDLENLQQKQPGQRFSWPHIMSIMAPVIEAMLYLHRQKPPIVHRDIKPANIIMQKEDGTAVLVGLGLVKTCDSVARKDDDRFLYRAPEQYSGGNIDACADIYALGATFYTLATGKLPPYSRSHQARTSDPLEFAQSAAPAIPLQKGRAIARAMSLDAGRRFSSVEQFWDALWLLEENPVPTLWLSHVLEGPPAPSGPGPWQAPEKPAAEPLPNESKLDSTIGQEDPEPTVRLPGKPQGETVPDSIEEREDSDATVRLPNLPPDVHRAGSDQDEEQKEPNAEKRPPEASAESMSEHI